MSQPGYNEPVVKVIAHRGCSAKAPENTLAAFRLAIELKCDLIEMDVQFSRELEPLVIHDSTLNRTTSGRGAVAEWSAGEILQLDAGSWFDAGFARARVPSLKQVLEHFGAEAPHLLIELKEGDLLEAGCSRAAQEVVDAGMASRSIVQSFEIDALLRIRESHPEVPRAALFKRSRPDYVRDALEAGADYLVLFRRLLSAGVIQDAHQKNLQVFVWTVDKPREIQKVIGLGVDGIISNHPERVFRVLQSPGS